VEEDKAELELRIKDARGKMIGKFKLHEVVGWWMEE
jgi:hypothetical protein